MKFKELKFIKMNPAGNTTLLFINDNLEKNLLKEISRIAMEETNLYAEQVGFISNNHLQMMGGEFCGNASRSFATYLAFNDPDFKNEKTYNITCSGENSILNVEVRATEFKNQYFAKIKMPKNTSIEKITVDNYLSCYEVIFTGITHFIVEHNIDEKIISTLEKYSKEKGYSAFGIMFFNEKENKMVPFVKVENFDGVWENSCGSGTTAVGYFLKKYKNIESAKINQPGGWLEVSFKNDDIYIDGPVEIVAQGISYMNI